MNITVKERKFSFRSKYDITTPDSNYYAVKSLLPFGGFRLLSGDHEQTLARIRRRMSFFRAGYDFQLPQGTAYRFWREGFWRGVFFRPRLRPQLFLGEPWSPSSGQAKSSNGTGSIQCSSSLIHSCNLYFLRTVAMAGPRRSIFPRS